eukprot:8860368-Lingulodinium_polyedra.AAC.1
MYKAATLESRTRLDLWKEPLFVQIERPPEAFSKGSRRPLDYWVSVPGRWIRVHRGPRFDLYTPL